MLLSSLQMVLDISLVHILYSFLMVKDLVHTAKLREKSLFPCYTDACDLNAHTYHCATHITLKI